MFYTFIFLWREISLTSKMFYSKNTRVTWEQNYINLEIRINLETRQSTWKHQLIISVVGYLPFYPDPTPSFSKWSLQVDSGVSMLIAMFPIQKLYFQVNRYPKCPRRWKLHGL